MYQYSLAVKNARRDAIEVAVGTEASELRPRDVEVHDDVGRARQAVVNHVLAAARGPGPWAVVRIAPATGPVVAGGGSGREEGAVAAGSDEVPVPIALARHRLNIIKSGLI
jgi:hypothetical protein